MHPARTGYVCAGPTKQDPRACEEFLRAWHQHKCHPMEMDEALQLRVNWTVVRNKFASRGKGT
eukprot:2780433-Pyramimonas_sp.AAC.1